MHYRLHTELRVHSHVVTVGEATANGIASYGTLCRIRKSEAAVKLIGCGTSWDSFPDRRVMPGRLLIKAVQVRIAEDPYCSLNHICGPTGLLLAGRLCEVFEVFQTIVE